MKCAKCSLVTPWHKAPEGGACIACAGTMVLDSDDFLLYGMNDLVKENRPGQVDMGRLVEKVIKEESIALIEGPVGSGKSFGYGVPAILSGKRIVISTAKKQLQHQLARKDIPFLGTKMGKDVTVALLKGKGNYACRVKAYDVPKEQQKDFIAWLDKSEYGDQTDYPGQRPPFWSSVTAEDCVGAKCKFADKCGYWKAKQEVKTAQVIIANHHVVAFDLKFGPRKFLGEYDTLIIDEAHQAPSSFRGAFGLTLSPYTAQHILRMLDATESDFAGLEAFLDRQWTHMFKLIADLDGEIPKDPFGAEGDATTTLLADLLKITSRDLKEAGAPAKDGGSYEDDDDEAATTSNVNWSVVARLEMLKKSIERPMEALKLIKEPGENNVIYVQTSAKGSKSLTVAPISVGPAIAAKWEMIPSVIVTSATMAVAGTFDDIKSQLGIGWKPKAPPVAPAGAVSPAAAAAALAVTEKAPKKVEELILPSPFNYQRQGLLFTPKDVLLPAPPAGPRDGAEKKAARDAYIRNVSAHCKRLITASGGNAFILFTSNQDLNDVHAALLEEDMPFPLFTQGDDAEAAFRQFQATPNSVVMGNKSFWEGVDVQGDKLWLVVLVKLPFPLLSDPVLLARQRQLQKRLEEKGMAENAIRSQLFNTLQVPAMITDLRQGAGRLIRSKTDKGVLAILDGRVWTGSSRSTPSLGQSSYQGYGGQAVNATGFGQRTSDFRVVSQLFNAWRASKK